MNKEQLAAAYKLIRLMDGDEVAQADANSHGNWHRNLVGFLVEAIANEVDSQNTNVSDFAKELSA